MFVHQIDPVIGQVSGFYLWYYGLSYTLGFLAVFVWLSLIRHDLRFSSRAVYDAPLWPGPPPHMGQPSGSLSSTSKAQSVPRAVPRNTLPSASAG